MRYEGSSRLIARWRVWLFASIFALAPGIGFGQVADPNRLAAFPNEQEAGASPAKVLPVAETERGPIADETSHPVRVLVFHPEASIQAEEALRQSFNKIRAEFIEDLYRASKSRRLTLQQTKHPGFQQFVVWFRKKRADFPLSASLARAWAIGDEDELKERCASELRRALGHYVGPTVPGQTTDVRVVPVEIAGKALFPQVLEAFAFNVAGSNVFSLAQVRDELIRTFESDDKSAGRYVAQFLRPNCLFDERVALAFANPLAPVPEDPGRTIPTRQDSTDASQPTTESTTKEAARPLAFALEWSDDIRLLGVSLLGAFRTGVSWAQANAEDSPLLLAIILVSLALLAGARFLMRRSAVVESAPGPERAADTVVLNAARNETIFLPVKTDCSRQLIVADTASSGALVETSWETELLAAPLDAEWQNRIAATEKRAEELLNQVRAGLAPHLARELTNEVIRRLLVDRA